MADKLENNFFGMNLIWFFGVVEDRNDPIKLGRVRVRCLGWHTDDKKLLPIASLPWAQCIQPVTSAATSGIGRSPTGLVEGSWVFGFFMDGKDAQKPMVIGSLAGLPTEEPDNTKGFNGIYPTILGEPDIPRPARGEAEGNLIAFDGILPTKLADRQPRDRQYETKIQGKINDVVEAVAPSVKAIDDKEGTDYNESLETGVVVPTWNEPNPRYGGESIGEPPASKVSEYPLNHVHVSESGHLFEVDDSPGAERIHQYHRTGTFVEILPNGTRSTKVVGKDYEIVISDKKVKIDGKMTVSIDGDAKLLVKGNQYIEVNGDQYVTVHGDRITKIQGSDIKEVKTDQNTNIEGDKHERVGKNRSEFVQENHKENIQGKFDALTNKDWTNKVYGNLSEDVFGSDIRFSVGKRGIGTGADFDIAASTSGVIKSNDGMNINTTRNDADITVVSGRNIHLNPD